MTRSILIAASLATASTAAAAPAPDWSGAAKTEVALASFKYTPRTIRIRAGQPVVLHLVNVASGGHDFSAPEFFAAAQLRAADRAAVRDGRVELRGGASRDIGLVAKAGRYRLRCTHTFHKTLGMTGEIVVE